MHEAALAEGLLKLVGQAVEEHNRQHPKKPVLRVLGITCEAGLLGGFEFQTLSECLEIFAEGGICEGASLNLRYKPLSCLCRNCSTRFELEKRSFVCPACGSPELDFKGGHGLDLMSLDVECEENNG